MFLDVFLHAFCIPSMKRAGEVKGISALAISLAGLSAVLRSMRAVWQHDILTDKSVTVSLEIERY